MHPTMRALPRLQRAATAGFRPLFSTTTNPATARAFSSSRQAQIARMTLLGRLGATPEVTSTASGKEIVKYSLAHTSGNGDNKQTHWFNVVSYTDAGPRRDLMTSLDPGAMLYVEAEASMYKYEAEDGSPRTRLSLVERNFTVLSNKPKEGEAAARE